MRNIMTDEEFHDIEMTLEKFQGPWESQNMKMFPARHKYEVINKSGLFNVGFLSKEEADFLRDILNSVSILVKECKLYKYALESIAEDCQHRPGAASKEIIVEGYLKEAERNLDK